MWRGCYKAAVDSGFWFHPEQSPDFSEHFHSHIKSITPLPTSSNLSTSLRPIRRQSLVANARGASNLSLEALSSETHPVVSFSGPSSSGEISHSGLENDNVLYHSLSRFVIGVFVIQRYPMVWTVAICLGSAPRSESFLLSCTMDWSRARVVP